MAALGALCVSITLPEGLNWPARAALLAFGGAAVFWTLTDLSGAYVAVAAALFLVAVRGVEQQALIDGLALQLHFWRGSDSLRHHDSRIMDLGGLD
ncbi:hypothetical protein ADL19_28110 [Streptomyces purpurogeneiscleroticus]|nr:hypothetical protein ADL19_28110 [Streptomyces purpurogeneiscleroticus]